MDNDSPIHLAGFSICEKKPHSEASVTVPIWITQSSLDGMQAIIKFCDGMEAAGKGRISGSFELLMFYRTIRSCISKENAAALSKKSE